MRSILIFASAILIGCLSPALALGSNGREIHVSSASGADDSTGTPEKPLATLEGARNLVRKLNAAGTPLGGGVSIQVHGGSYPLERPFELGAEDSGTSDAPIVYCAVGGKQARITCARKLRPEDFQPVEAPGALSRIAEPLRGKIVELNLATLGMKPVGQFADVFDGRGGIPDLFFGGRRMPLSRFPNSGFMTIKQVIDTGGGQQGKDWRNPSSDTKRPGAVGGTFQYRDEFAPQFDRWQHSLERGVWLKGYWRVMWENEAIRVQSIDTEKHTVTFAKPVSGGIGNKYHRPQGNGLEQYWALNLLEEVDQPGEWCIDFKDQKIYFYPPASLDKAEILLADREEPVIHLRNASHVVLANLLVEDCGGDGIRIDGGEADLVAGCTVREVDQYGVVLNGGARHTVQSCDLYNLGAGGIWLGGGNEKSDPRIPAGHRVVNNHIHDFAQIQRIYAPGINCGFTGGGGGGHHPAVGMYVAHNLIHDAPHAGVLFGSWDNVFEYNEVFRYATISNDIGAFYCYDRFEQSGNDTFRYNFMHSTDDGDGIYFDHDHRDMHLFGNIAYFKSTGKRGTAYLYKIGSQAKNTQVVDCQNNISMACNVGFEFVDVLPSEGKIENNVAVQCKAPWLWRVVKEGRESAVKNGFATGKNVAYETDPGFTDVAAYDFRLKPDSRIFKDLPKFQAIPVEQIGLHIDEYRKVLPTAGDIDRFGKRAVHSGPGYDVEDRK